MIAMGLLGRYRALPGPIWAIFVANVVNQLGTFVWPFLTLLLTERMGLAPERAGFFVSLATLAYLPGMLLGGKLADRFGRKRVLIASRLGFAALLLPCAAVGLSPAVPWLIIGAMVANGAAEPATAAMASDLARGEERPAAFSLLYLGTNLGYAVGPMVAGLLFREHASLLFAGDALTSLLSAGLVAATVPETLPSRDAGEVLPEAERDEEGGLVSALRRRPRLLTFGLFQIAYTLVYVQFAFSLPLQMNALFGDRGPALYGALMTVNALTVVALTVPMVRVTERIGPGVAVALGGLAYAVGFGALYVVRSFGLVVASTAIWSMGEVLVVTNTKAYVADRAPRTHRGRFQAAMQALSGTGFTFGPMLGGAVIGTWGLPALWRAAFLLGLVGAGGVLAITTSERGRAGTRGPPEPGIDRQAHDGV